jgi:3-oxoacyl-[acyl-carrier-protein] synthase II
MKRRVVITGMGAMTPIGLTIDEIWDSLKSGKNGIYPITKLDTSLHVTKMAGELKKFDPWNYMDKKMSRRMCEYSQFAVAAAKMSIEDSELDLEKEDRTRIGVIVGSGIGGMVTFEREVRKLINGKPGKVSPFFIPMLISDIASGYISIIYGLKGPNYATTSACATSAHAIGNAFRTIQYNDADIVVAGGSEAPITDMGMAGFNNMKALSERNDDPEKASRPFDATRDGFVMGEGGGILVLEELEHAKKRGAKIHAEITGIGYTADAFHITAPDQTGDGATNVMRIALKDAGLEPKNIDYINAHGTSTPFNDKIETLAIKRVFGDYANQVAISSTKSMMGHLLGAAGAAESIVCMLAIQNNIVPPTINYETPDPECDLNYTPNKFIEKEINVTISNSFGFGGHNVSLVLQRYQD